MDLEKEFNMLEGVDLGKGPVVGVDMGAGNSVSVSPTPPVTQPAPSYQPSPATHLVQNPVNTVVQQPQQVVTLPQPPVNNIPMVDLEQATKETEGYKIEQIDLGQKVSSAAITRFTGTVGQQSRIRFLEERPIPITLHWDNTEGLKSFICFKGDCCSLSGTARTKYCFPIIEYPVVPNSMPIQPIQGQPVHLKLLPTSGELYEQIVSAYSTNGTILGYDFIINCSQGQFKKLSATPCRDTWKEMFPDFDAEAGRWPNVKSISYTAVGRYITPEMYKKIKEQNDQPYEAPPIPTYNDIMGI